MAIVRLTLLFLLVSGFAMADDRRAQVNYMLHCQGCHLPEAEGFAGKVPPMKDFVGFFLHSEAGRDFLIRVPGVAHAALSHTEVAELMNWLLQSFSEDQLPEPFVPYTRDEVAVLRDDPERNPEAVRRAILSDLAATIPDIAADLENESTGRR
ncbi:MAG: c-type cytochrome [Woeseiaceae bacterium]